MSDPDRPLIYISYRWRGAKRIADGLVHTISQELPDVEIFQDSVSLKPGDHWSTRLQQALGRASVLLVLLDKRWLRHADHYGRRRLDDPTDWVRLEIERALKREIPIVPVLLEGARLPPAEALPSSLRPLASYQAYSLSGGKLDNYELVSHLRRVMSGPTVEHHQVSDRGFQVLELELENFRCFEHLQIDLTRESSLNGDWTCIAGLNGSGKSTVLQALAILMMGPEKARELGGRRLDSMRRLDSRYQQSSSLLRARAQLAGDDFTLEVTISSRGPQSSDMTFWERSQDLLSVGYGASRNVSDAPDRYDELSPVVSGFISLFDPMARLQNAQSLFESSLADRNSVWASEEFEAILADIFAREIVVHQGGSPVEMQFSTGGAAHDVLDLPDGYRSSVAWLADLCGRAANLSNNFGSKSTSLRTMSGLVMVDEIDLHLHASLQRAIVPRLRRALPKLQWIVTSHAPLVLASFDRNELVPLDGDEEGGVRELDRQILGFSADQVYDFFLHTPPSSEALEDQLAEALITSQDRREELEEILNTTPSGSEDETQARMARIRQRIRDLKR